MFNIGAEYVLALWGGDITTRLDYARRGDTYYDRANGPYDKQKAYGLISANIRFERDNWYVAMYGKNLGDEDYVTGQIINPPFNCGCRTIGVGEPLTYGLEVGYSMD
jgi:iron complex outermembrane receptor protein